MNCHEADFRAKFEDVHFPFFIPPERSYHSAQEELIINRIPLSWTNCASTASAPLAAFGSARRRAGLLRPLLEVNLPIKTVDHTPGDKLVEALALILAGGRSTSQIDWLLRPNLALAQAGGQKQFSQQATWARTLDAFDSESIASLRLAFETLLKQNSLALNHDYRFGPLWLDGDLPGLPASRHAEGRAKGDFAGKNTGSDDNGRVSASVRTGRRSAHCSIQAVNTRSGVCGHWLN